jgi:hypothetical protein
MFYIICSFILLVKFWRVSHVILMNLIASHKKMIKYFRQVFKIIEQHCRYCSLCLCFVLGWLWVLSIRTWNINNWNSQYRSIHTLWIVFGSFIFGFSILWSRMGIQRSKFRIFRVVHQEKCINQTSKNAQSYNAKSIENRYDSLKILTKLFETFCPLHERPPFWKG